jgi:hypothetical protein
MITLENVGELMMIRAVAPRKASLQLRRANA